MSNILFRKMRKQTETLWTSGVGVEANVLKRKLAYSMLMNAQSNKFDQFIYEN